MPRVKRGVAAHRRHRRALRAAQGYWGGRRRLISTVKDTLMRALRNAYRDRRRRKRSFRQLWIARINAAARMEGVTYSRLTAALKNNGVTLNRKTLAEMAVKDLEGFRQLVKSVTAGAAK